MKGTSYKVGPRSWRARLTIGGRIVISVPVGPWLKMAGAWWIASKQKVAKACARAKVPCPSDLEIHEAVKSAFAESIREMGENQ
jgi:hypothetical protein